MAHLDQDDLKAIGTLIADKTAGPFSEIRADISSLKTDVSGLKTDVSGLKTDVSSLKTDMTTLKNIQSNQGMTLMEIRTDVRQLKGQARKQGVLYEDLNERFKADSEVLRKNFEIKVQVDDHENRIGDIEETQGLMRKTLRIHSKQLRTKPR